MTHAPCVCRYMSEWREGPAKVHRTEDEEIEAKLDELEFKEAVGSSRRRKRKQPQKAAADLGFDFKAGAANEDDVPPWFRDN